MSILITGGAGFIGSHTAVEFLNAGYEIIVVDNYCNSSPKSIERVKEITGKDFKVYEVDMCDKVALEKVFQENPEIDSAIHFAGLKAVGESVQMPGLYYYNNLLSTLRKALKDFPEYQITLEGEDRYVLSMPAKVDS